MTVLRRATESQFSDSYDEETIWRTLNEGFWCFEIGKPELVIDSFGKRRVKFPLTLTESEQKRLKAEVGDDLPEGTLQSWRSSYRPGLTLGYHVKADGSYKSTYLIDFLCAALGTETGKRMRKWIEAGGGPRRPDDPDDDVAELELIAEWLGWWEGLQVYGTITHSRPDNQGRIWANFAGPMPLGSLPNQPELDYQALCRGKFRVMRAESGQDPEPPAARAAQPPTTAATAAAIRDEVVKARAKIATVDDDDDAPF